MTYKLNPDLRLIKSPVILTIDGNERHYPSGDELIELELDKQYLVETITARDGCIVVSLKDNDRINVINWIGEEAVSFL